MSTDGRVLVAGAGVAGLATAYWLRRAGYAVTVAEQAPALRVSGYPIDVRGLAVPVAERMGVMVEIRAAGAETEWLRFVDDSGRPRSSANMGALRRATATGEAELARGALLRILRAAAGEQVEFLFDDGVAALSEDADGVTVGFTSGRRDRYDLLVGADGTHSTVRRLAFGPEERFTRDFGMHVAVATVDPRMGRDPEALMYSRPGTVAGLHHFRGASSAVFMYAGPQRPLPDVFAGQGWQVPALLTQALAAPDLFTDAIVQIHMPRWSSGRTVLVGDAAHCTSLLAGQGSSLAMLGGYRLAGALVAAGGDHAAAFARYESAMRPTVTAGQRGIGLSAGLLVARSATTIRVRDAVLGLWPLAAAAARLGRLGRRPAREGEPGTVPAGLPAG